MQELIIENIPVLFSRKNIKNINLRISKPDGIVKISAPYLTSMKSVEEFVIKNKEWIINSQSKIKTKSTSQSSNFLFDSNFIFDTGKLIKVWSKKYTLEILPSFRWGILLDDKLMRANFYVTHNSSNDLKLQFLKKWYKQELLEKAAHLFKKWLDFTGLAPAKIDVRFTKSVWGTCNNKTGRIMLNGQLATLNPKYLDYVILHELTHLKYSNHGQDFKNFMSAYMPDWKTYRKELNG